MLIIPYLINCPEYTAYFFPCKHAHFLCTNLDGIDRIHNIKRNFPLLYGLFIS